MSKVPPAAELRVQKRQARQDAAPNKRVRLILTTAQVRALLVMAEATDAGLFPDARQARSAEAAIKELRRVINP